MKQSRRFATLVAVVLLSACASPPIVQPSSSLALSPSVGYSASPRLNGGIYTPPPLTPRISLGSTRRREAGVPANATAGQYSLDFSDTDVREVVARVAGSMLGLNYLIDPAVKGTVTLHSARPLTAQQLLPALQAALGSVGAVLVRADDGLYRVVPAATAGSAGSIVMPLDFVSAEDLAKVLQPFAGTNARVTADPSLNAMLINGDPAQVQSLADLIRTFDSDVLSNQSFAVLPVAESSAKDLADAMTQSLRGKGAGGLGSLIRVVPLTGMNAVLVVSPQPRYIEDARRVFDLIERQRGATVRTWYTYYLQNSSANDIAHTLQMAFTPNNVTAQPESAQQPGGAAGAAGLGGYGASGRSGMGATGFGAGGLGGGAAAGGLTSMGAGGMGSPGGADSLGGTVGSAGAVGAASPAPVQSPAANPLLGGLDQSTQGATADTMRILPSTQNNAILIYGTTREIGAATAMLRKIDITPLQVRIDAVIAEVTLNDALQYGTQFFFKSGGVNGILNNATAAVASVANTVLGTNFPGFLIGGNGQGGAPLAISALQAVSQVNVLSSPQITVVDNQQARLQVGALVPYLTATSQSTLTSNAPVINSISYQPTGVIMQITPRVNSGGQVTLDVTQVVSDVNNTPNASGINSPTFNERSVTTRVVVPDGATIGLAGLIQDSSSHGNQGIPWLKDIPILGALAGTQNNQRQRTELLVLLTPHVIRDQADLRTLTQDLRNALPNAAQVPHISQTERISGSPDPNRRIIEKAQGYIERHNAPR